MPDSSVDAATDTAQEPAVDGALDTTLDTALDVLDVAVDASASDAGIDCASLPPDGAVSAQFTQGTGPVRPAESVAFGFRVGLSRDGSTLVVGDNFGGTPRNGAVTVFVQGNGAWREQAQLMRPAGAVGFGYSVAISGDGDTVAVGDPEGGAGQAGMVTLFRRSNGTWSATGTVPRTSAARSFGSSVALSDSGSTLAIGDPSGDGGPGAVTVFESSAAWSDLATVAPTSLVRPSVAYLFGHAVALNADGSLLAVADPGGANPGRVTFYERQTGWRVKETILGPSGAGDFSWSLALSPDGRLLAVGAPNGATDPNGGALLFENQCGTWVGLGAVTRPPNSMDFGWSVAIDGLGTLLVGDPNGGDGFSGAVYAYVRRGNTWMAQGALPRPASSLTFGASVAIAATGQVAAAGDHAAGGASPRGAVATYSR